MSRQTETLPAMYDGIAQWFAVVALVFALIWVASGDPVTVWLGVLFGILSGLSLYQAAVTRPVNQ